MVGKKREKNFNISNKLAYTLIVIALIVGLGIGVLAYGGSAPSTMGHTLSEISMPACSNGQVLAMVGGAWACAVPAGNDPRFTISTSGLCYNAPATCSTTLVGCSASASIQYSFNTCSTTPQVGMDQLCSQQCKNQKGYACDGTSASCSGGTIIQYNGVGTSCSPSLNILYCTCTASGTYTQATPIPAGQRCI